MVMAWSVDRLGRSLQDLVGFLSELHALKIDLFLRQQGLDTTTPAGKAMFQMMGVFAEFERAMIQERVRAGLARARSEGKRLGRPPIAPTLEKRIREALATPGRPGIRFIAEQFGVNTSTVSASAALSTAQASPWLSLGSGSVRALTFVEQAVTNRIANATYVLDLGLQRPAVLANSNFVILQPC
jgi:DNA invertase Pin-like site-specific DNA recombinase